MNPNDEKYGRALCRLLEIMNELREHCPWDREQTWESLRHLMIEETFELSDAILEGRPEEVKQELGDLLLHIVFYSKIASEQGIFDLAEVMETLCDKLIFRHPHVFGGAPKTEKSEVQRHWELLKLQTTEKKVLSGVPHSLPALIKALRIQEKVRGVGFDWSNKEEVWAKIEEEMNEVKQSLTKGDQESIESEWGDLLFSLVNYSRFLKINPEDALEKTNKKFIRRFNELEEAIKLEGKHLSEMTLLEIDSYWEKVKKPESRKN